MSVDIAELLDTQKAIREIPEWKLRFAQQTGWKIPVGPETRPGWSGSIPFYVFYCPDCEVFSKDYGHSWPESRYVNCQRCDRLFRFPKLSAVISSSLATVVVLARFAVRQRLQRGGST